jgi:hypothetical protein
VRLSFVVIHRCPLRDWHGRAAFAMGTAPPGAHEEEDKDGQAESGMCLEGTRTLRAVVGEVGKDEAEDQLGS